MATIRHVTSNALSLTQEEYKKCSVRIDRRCSRGKSDFSSHRTGTHPPRLCCVGDVTWFATFPLRCITEASVNNTLDACIDYDTVFILSLRRVKPSDLSKVARVIYIYETGIPFRIWY